ncbi:MAG: hypothetical protein CMH32_03715 [Micavibrio sp.]|nr:hypothetical protein [Micavibrio sp.]|tara:strand:+ start:763 stop:1146 length:384 start_codon:yes stop_codon:yes gene_type:complete
MGTLNERHIWLLGCIARYCDVRNKGQDVGATFTWPALYDGGFLASSTRVRNYKNRLMVREEFHRHDTSRMVKPLLEQLIDAGILEKTKDLSDRHTNIYKVKKPLRLQIQDIQKAISRPKKGEQLKLL